MLLKYIAVTLNIYYHTSSKQNTYLRTRGWEEVKENSVSCFNEHHIWNASHLPARIIY